jgi:hypothetical protein
MLLDLQYISFAIRSIYMSGNYLPNSQMCCVLASFIILVQRHRDHWTSRFYWLPSNIFSVTDDPGSFYCWSISWQIFLLPGPHGCGNFHLGEEMAVLTCEDYRLGCKIEANDVPPYWRDSQWGAWFFPVFFSLINYLYVSFPQLSLLIMLNEINILLFTEKDWESPCTGVAC